MQPYRLSTEWAMDRVNERFQEYLSRHKATRTSTVSPPQYSPRPSGSLTPPASPTLPLSESQSVGDVPPETNVAIAHVGKGKGRAGKTNAVPGPSRGSSSGTSPSTSAGQKAGENRRYRTAYTEHQLVRLEKEYSENRYIHRTKRIDLGKELGLTEGTIKVWFQNRRMRDKRLRHLYSWPPYAGDPAYTTYWLQIAAARGIPNISSPWTSSVVPGMGTLPAVPCPSLPNFNSALCASVSPSAPYPGAFTALPSPPYISRPSEAQAYISDMPFSALPTPPLISHFLTCPALSTPPGTCRCGWMHPPVTANSGESASTETSLTSPPVPKSVQKRKSPSDTTAKESSESGSQSVSDSSNENFSSESSASTRPKLFKPYDEEAEGKV